MAVIRWMKPGEEADVRKLYATCHPGWPARPPQWFQAYPTLVAVEGKRVVGFTSFAIAYPTTPAIGTAELIIYGQDVCVSPDHRGEGIGQDLSDERLRVAKTVGATFFVGFTWKQNKSMIRIFEKQGMREHTTIAKLHPGGVDGVLYVGPVN